MSLSKILEACKNQDSFNSCDRMYESTFRSEPMRLDSLEGWQSYLYDLKSELAKSIFMIETGSKAPLKPETKCEQVLDFYYQDLEQFEEQASEWFNNKYPDFELDSDTLVVELCNYKGEGVGDEIGLFFLYENAPIFTCKKDSFFAVNH